MPTTFYLRDGGAGVAGCFLAGQAIGATARGVNGKLQLVSSATDLQWTTTLGGSDILAWATRPLSAPVTIAGSVSVNIWGRELNGTGNAQFRVKLFRFDTALSKTLFGTLDQGAEMASGSPVVNTYSASPTSTAFAVGERIGIEIWAGNFGTMGSTSADIYYSGDTAGARGDTFLTFAEDIRTARTARFM